MTSAAESTLRSKLQSAGEEEEEDEGRLFWRWTWMYNNNNTNNNMKSTKLFEKKNLLKSEVSSYCLKIVKK